MELKLDYLTIRTSVPDSVHASVRPEHVEKGRTTTGASEDLRLISPAVLAARDALVVAALAEITHEESGKSDALPVSAVEAPAEEVPRLAEGIADVAEGIDA